VERLIFKTGGLILAFALLAAPLLAQTQPAGKMPRIGVLRLNAPDDPVNELMRQLLRDLGYAEGAGIAIEWRLAEGRTERLPAYAAELARLKLDAVVATGDLAIRAIRQATSTIPIIAGSDDLVGEGHVASLARPGGNITGVSILASELNAAGDSMSRRPDDPLLISVYPFDDTPVGSEPSWRDAGGAECSRAWLVLRDRARRASCPAWAQYRKAPSQEGTPT
jgi:hypothetical protein